MQKIPKTIHYCWFGRGKKPELFEMCLQSWKKICPDYDFVEWNEDNFDVNFCTYTQQAYEQKKYAFVSDVARIWAVYNFGGIYLDTDVELTADISHLLSYDAWFASEGANAVNTGLGFGAQKNHYLLKAILDDYKSRDLVDLTPCVNLNTKVIKNELNGFEFAAKTGVYDNVLILASRDYEKFAKHYYAGSWADNSKKKDSKLKWKLFHFFERPSILRYCEKHNNILTKAYSFFLYELIACGFVHSVKLIFSVFKRK